MASGALLCTGDVTIASDGAPLCSGFWSLVPVPEPFDITTADPAMYAEAFFVGFTLIGTIWFAGICCRKVLSMIR